ncbi:Modulator of FtsH protease HflC [Rickettsiales bacterium Ac37b]|nr:Modulator of FtsH protease HflC [Rickettsiales bacterium Ac37b]
MTKKTIFTIITITALILLINTLFIVDQRQQALIFQFGEVVKVEKSPGLHFKLPFIQNIIYFDNRLLNVTADEKEVIANDQKRLIISAFARYKIIDPLKFYQTVRDESGIKLRLNTMLDSSLRQVLGEVPLVALLTNERSNIMKKIKDLINSQTLNFGIDVIDVRILRADLPKENSNAIYKRMQTEREKEAKELRAEGAGEAQRIKSKADKDKAVLLAEAKRDADITRGEGDGIAAKIFADNLGKDPEFFDFYRSLQAYKKVINKDNTTLVLSPKSEFFKYLKDLDNK